MITQQILKINGRAAVEKHKSNKSKHGFFGGYYWLTRCLNVSKLQALA